MGSKNPGNSYGKPIINKLYCDYSSDVELLIRKRPTVVNGGGFVVLDFSQNIVFRVEGCGVLGTKGELFVRDSAGEPLVFIHRTGGLNTVFKVYKKWKGRRFSSNGSMEGVFTLKEAEYSWILKKNKNIRICTIPRRSLREWDFEVTGYFPDRLCAIVDHVGNVVAQIEADNPMGESLAGNYLYKVTVRQGTDQAFVLSLIAILDNMHGESTT